MAPARSLLLALGAPLLALARCPAHYQGTPPEGHAPVPDVPTYKEKLDALDVGALMADIETLLTKSQDCWPADFGNYGPFFIRLAWHCSGTYRQSDGRGGCGGGRQRFAPEAHWEDNENLDKARALLYPIKEKYGDGLSWGDLFVTAGTTAIKSMGGPVSQVCFGRVDDPDGTSSLDLGPSTYQEKVAPCAINGKCELPLGTTTVGLIYVNPEGPAKADANGKLFQNPDPSESAPEIREVFARMGMNDTETVALIGGGHAFGKTHGACPDGPDKCGSGVGQDAYTSGLEGPWTTTPTKWSNEFFTYLLDREWEKHKGPGGKWQFRVKGTAAASVKHADIAENNTGGLKNSGGLMRLTTDMALIHDEEYMKIVQRFASSQSALDNAFAAAWLKLTTSGGRWAKNKRCIGGDVDDDTLTSKSGRSAGAFFGVVSSLVLALSAH